MPDVQLRRGAPIPTNPVEAIRNRAILGRRLAEEKALAAQHAANVRDLQAELRRYDADHQARQARAAATRAAKRRG